MPCAILLDLARVLPSLVHEDIGVDLVFFDGEEAFVQWTATDSLCMICVEDYNNSVLMWLYVFFCVRMYDMCRRL